MHFMMKMENDVTKKMKMLKNVRHTVCCLWLWLWWKQKNISHLHKLFLLSFINLLSYLKLKATKLKRSMFHFRKIISKNEQKENNNNNKYRNNKKTHKMKMILTNKLLQVLWLFFHKNKNHPLRIQYSLEWWRNTFTLMCYMYSLLRSSRTISVWIYHTARVHDDVFIAL